MAALIDGIEADTLSIADRGLTYGDGIFRTLRMRNGAPLLWERHYRKIASDCAALAIPCPDRNALLADLAKLAQTDPDCIAKIIVTRGQGGRGYAVSAAVRPTRIVTTSPLPDYPEEFHWLGVKVHLCDIRLGSQPRLAGVKHLNRLENVLARMEWNRSDIAEGILLDGDGNAVEGTMSNLFLFKDGVLYTPELSRCGVAGVQRERIMDFAAGMGVRAEVQPLPLAAVMNADEIMLCNSVIGVWRVREFNGKVWPDEIMSARLNRLAQDGND